VVFNGKKAAALWLGQTSGRIAFDAAHDPHAVARRLFVLPSTSGMARRHWDATPWQTLSVLLRRTAAAARPSTCATISAALFREHSVLTEAW
jgi:hypothetical protein